MRTISVALLAGLVVLSIAGTSQAQSDEGAGDAENAPAMDPEPAETEPEPAESESTQPFVQVRLIMELGGLAPVAHTVKFSKDGTRFDYIEEGGQDNVFLFWRPTAELTLDRAHTLVLLY